MDEMSFSPKYDFPNAETQQAIEEVNKLKNDPNKKIYDSFAEILDEIEKNDKE